MTVIIPKGTLELYYEDFYTKVPKITTSAPLLCYEDLFKNIFVFYDVCLISKEFSVLSF